MQLKCGVRRVGGKELVSFVALSKERIKESYLGLRATRRNDSLNISSFMSSTFNSPEDILVWVLGSLMFASNARGMLVEQI